MSDITIQMGNEEVDVSIQKPDELTRLILKIDAPDYSDDEYRDIHSEWVCRLVQQTTDFPVDVEHVARLDGDELLYLIESCLTVFDEIPDEIASREEFFDEDDQNSFIDSEGSVSKLYE